MLPRKSVLLFFISIACGQDLNTFDNLFDLNNTEALCATREWLTTYAESNAQIDKIQLKNAKSRLEALLKPFGPNPCETPTEDIKTISETTPNPVYDFAEYGSMKDAYSSLKNTTATGPVEEEHYLVMDDKANLGDKIMFNALCTDCQMDYDEKSHQDFEADFAAAEESAKSNPFNKIKKS